MNNLNNNNGLIVKRGIEVGRKTTTNPVNNPYYVRRRMQIVPCSKHRQQICLAVADKTSTP